MIRAWNEVLKDLDGVDFQRIKMRNGEPELDDKNQLQREKITTGMAIIDALVGTIPGDENHSGTDRMRRVEKAEMMVEILKNGGTGDFPMTPADIKEIKERINKCGYHSVIVARVWRILDAVEAGKAN